MATPLFWPTDSITFCGASVELGQLMHPNRPRIQRLEPGKPVREPPKIAVAEFNVDPSASPSITVLSPAAKPRVSCVRSLAISNA
jgi:hypothetical protein